MDDGAKPPEPDETLDAPVYEPPRKRRLTLVAFMLVILVVGLLGVLVATAVLRMARRTRLHVEQGNRCFIDNLHIGCVNFERNCGQYPWTKPDAVRATTTIDGKDVWLELRGLPGATINTHHHYYLDESRRNVKDGAPVDTWGHEIQFRVDSKTGQAVIWSCGPNGIDETNDGESPDPAKYPKSYYWFGKGDTGDDIVGR